MFEEGNAAAIRQHHRHGLRQTAGTALAEACLVCHDMIYHGIHKPRKLSFQKYGAAVERQPNRDTRRAMFVQWGIDEAACRKYLCEGDIVDGDLRAVAF